MKKFKEKFLKNGLGLNETEAKLVMEAQRKFPSILIDDGEGFCVDARRVHQELVTKAKVNKDGKIVEGTEFARWIKRRIKDYNFIQNEDYISVFKFDDAKFTPKQVEEMSSQRRSSYGITEEYKLTIEMAKQLSMIENNINGRLARRYFVLMEKAIKKNIKWQEVRHPERQGYRDMCSLLDEQYKKSHNGKKANSFTYSNNADMINRALFGHTSAQMKTIIGDGVEYEDSLRDNLQLEANKALQNIQVFNIGLIASNMSLQQRKILTENLCNTRYSNIKEDINKEFKDELHIDNENCM